MKLYFIRHGQSTNNLLWDQTQNKRDQLPDPELTDIGREQVAHVAQFLGYHKRNTHPASDYDDFNFTHLYSSFMVRAMDTATAIGNALDMSPVIWEQVHEGGGIWQFDEATGEPKGLPGKARVDFEARFPNFTLPDTLNDTGWWNRPFEDLNQIRARTIQFIIDLKTRHGGTDHRVAIVSHGGFYNCFMLTLLGLPILKPTAFWFMINNAAITRIDLVGEEVRIAYQNRVDFLPSDLLA